MKTVQHKFVEFIPEQLDAGVLYISLEYCTAIHLCVCGCGNQVVTPILPDQWHLTFNGDGVTLDPSIGNWDFECRSHYWIRENKIVSAPSRSYTKYQAAKPVIAPMEEIVASKTEPESSTEIIVMSENEVKKPSLLQRIFKYLFS